MAVSTKRYTVQLTDEFTSYLQNILNEDLGEKTPYLVAKISSGIFVEISGSEIDLNSLQANDLRLPNGTLSYAQIDYTEGDVPVLTGTMTMLVEYSAPSAPSYGVEILAVRDEDFSEA